MFITDPTIRKRYAALNRCVYCRCVLPAAVELTNEHVVPFALGGNLEIPTGVCGECKKRTESIDRNNINIHFLDGRVQLNLQSRRRNRGRKSKPPPSDLAISLQGQNRVTVSRAASLGLAPNIALPWLPWPGRLTGVPTHDITELEGEFWHSSLSRRYKHDMAALARDKEGGVHYEAQFHLGWFQLFLLKIAHSYAVAELGFDRFRPVFNGWPASDNEKLAFAWNELSYLVGGEGGVGGKPAREAEMHTLGGPHRFHGYIAVRIRLFADGGSPPYRVLVGTPVT